MKSSGRKLLHPPTCPLAWSEPAWKSFSVGREWAPTQEWAETSELKQRKRTKEENVKGDQRTQFCETTNNYIEKCITVIKSQRHMALNFWNSLIQWLGAIQTVRYAMCMEEACVHLQMPFQPVYIVIITQRTFRWQSISWRNRRRDRVF